MAITAPKLISFLFAAAAIAACALPIAAYGAEDDSPALTVHVFYFDAIVYCERQKDAEDIASAYAKGGESAANIVLYAKMADERPEIECGVHATFFRVVRVVSAYRSPGADMYVFEIKNLAGETSYLVRGWDNPEMETEQPPGARI